MKVIIAALVFYNGAWTYSTDLGYLPDLEECKMLAQDLNEEVKKQGLEDELYYYCRG